MSVARTSWREGGNALITKEDGLDDGARGWDRLTEGGGDQISIRFGVGVPDCWCWVLVSESGKRKAAKEKEGKSHWH